MLALADNDYYQAIKDYTTIMVFGANYDGLRDYNMCKMLKKDISCYLVSNRSTRAGSVIQGVPVRLIDDISPSEKQDSLVIVGRNQRYHQETVRMLRDYGFCHIIPGINQFTWELSEEQVAMLRDVFGNDLLFDIPSVEREKECSLKIYAVTSATNFHKASRSWDSKYIEYIQAGAALTEERICTLTDDTGENISRYNYYLNESTAGYWIAKNDVRHEYVGLFHYGRGMDLSDRQLEWIVEHDIDVVLKTPDVFAYNMFCHVGDTAYETVSQYAPDYVDTASWFLKNHFSFQGNIQISKREIFREYYEWAFSLLAGRAKMYPDSYLRDNGRAFGILMERLMNIWYIKNAKRFRFVFAPQLELF